MLVLRVDDSTNKDSWRHASATPLSEVRDVCPVWRVSGWSWSALRCRRHPCLGGAADEESETVAGEFAWAGPEAGAADDVEHAGFVVEVEEGDAVCGGGALAVISSGE